MNKTFEDFIEVIDREIEKRRCKWTLTALAWLDFDDVAQMIRIHINNKWDQFDQSRPIEPWINRIISHQIKNIRRNIYDSNSRPCLRCAVAEGDDLCQIYNKQCSACPLYAQWEKTKKHAYNVKLPVSIEHHSQQVYEMPYEDYNLLESAENIHKAMKECLKPVEWEIYKCLYINGLTEEETAKKMGYITNEKNRKPGYMTILKMQKSILEKVKKVLYD